MPVQLRVAFTGDFGPSTVSPRTLDSACISRLVKLEGIVTKCSLVRPKVMKTVHYSEAANKFVTKEYRDAASHQGLPTGSAYPTKDDEGNPLTTEFGLSVFRDHQVLTVQVCAFLCRLLQCSFGTERQSAKGAAPLHPLA